MSTDWNQRIFGFIRGDMIHLVWMLAVPPERLLRGLCVDHIDFSLFSRYWTNMSASGATWCKISLPCSEKDLIIYSCVLIIGALFVWTSSPFGWWKHVACSTGDPAPAARAAEPAAGRLRWEGLSGREAAEARGWPLQRPRLQPAGERPPGQRASHPGHPTLQVSRASASAQVKSIQH